jgi:hypothetical protein
MVLAKKIHEPQDMAHAQKKSISKGTILMGHRHESLPHTWMNEKRAYFPKLLAV